VHGISDLGYIHTEDVNDKKEERTTTGSMQHPKRMQGQVKQPVLSQDASRRMG
jgi:hypothetical protein